MTTPRHTAIALVAVVLVFGCAHTRKTGVVAGMVTDEHGKPLYSRVMVSGKPYGVATGADGKYSIPNVPAGTYTIRCKHSYLARRDPDVLDILVQDRDSTRVSPRDTTEVNFRLKIPTP